MKLTREVFGCGLYCIVLCIGVLVYQCVGVLVSAKY